MHRARKGTGTERNKVKEVKKKQNQHTGAWELMWMVGEDTNHQDRIVRRRASKSANLYKGHEAGDNEALSDGIYEVIDSSARALKSIYSVIILEDLVAKIH